MTAKTLKALLTLSALLILTACSTKKETIYVDKPVYVKVPVKCVVPDTNCSFDRKTDTEVISALLECIIEMKRNAEVCK